MSIRQCGSLKAVLWLAVSGLAPSACGAPAEVVQSPPPAKVVWDGEAASAPAEPEGKEDAPSGQSASAQDDPVDDPTAIDLDAPPPKSAPAAAAAAEEEPAEEAAPVDPGPSADPLAVELSKRRKAAKARTSAKEKKSKPKKSASTAVAASEAPAASKYSGSDPCRATSFSVPRVRDACASGGRAGAKRVMKDAIGKATATGQVLKCSSCHANQNDYALKDDAAANLKRWLDG